MVIKMVLPLQLVVLVLVLACMEASSMPLEDPPWTHIGQMPPIILPVYNLTEYIYIYTHIYYMRIYIQQNHTHTHTHTCKYWTIPQIYLSFLQLYIYM